MIVYMVGWVLVFIFTWIRIELVFEIRSIMIDRISTYCGARLEKITHQEIKNAYKVLDNPSAFKMLCMLFHWTFDQFYPDPDSLISQRIEQEKKLI